MFPKCPQCNAALDPGAAGSAERCPACGLIFAKYLQTQQGKAARAAASHPATAPGAESDGHDWQNILGDLGLIRRAHLIAGVAHKVGLAVMLTAYAWGAALPYLQFRRRDNDAIEGDS